MILRVRKLLSMRGTAVSDGRIELRGVEVHNLRSVDVDIPHQQLVVLCGVSGSGKTSLALDTLYAEGQRRYIESFSAYTRQFLQQLEKPAARRIDGIPPAIAVTHKNPSRSSRATVGTATEISDYLRILFARAGQVVCDGCGRPVQRDTAETAAASLEKLPEGTRYMITFPGQSTDRNGDGPGNWLEEGFVRAIAGGRMISLADAPAALPSEGDSLMVVVDRLSSGSATIDRVRDSLETAFANGEGRCHVFVENRDATAPASSTPPLPGGRSQDIDGRTWSRLGYSNRLVCEDCEREYPLPEPRLYSFNSPLGACPECEGFGNLIDIDMELVVPDPGKSLREGAIAPWNTPAYAHELGRVAGAGRRL